MMAVNDLISNKHCKLCSDSINLCSKCNNNSACDECMEPYSTDEFAQCTIMNDGDNCTRMFPYPEEDHGKACMQCNSTQCLKYEDVKCQNAKVFRGWGDSIGCYPCTELFGEGTITCDEQGATNCMP
jgi:hypothetical protein